MESSNWRFCDLCRDHIFGVHYPGSRDSSMVESWTHGQKVVGLIPGRGGG